MRPSPEISWSSFHELPKQERLSALLAGELNFHGENSSYASHDLHAFAAKFPPQLPRLFVRGLTAPGDVVLDPMMGSGTAVVEAILEGRRGLGFDLDPLASLLTKVKTTTLELEKLRQTHQQILQSAHALLSDGKVIEQSLSDQFDKATREFIDFWFLPKTQRELMALVLSVGKIDDPLIRRFFELNFSSIIVTKSGGVSLARDLAHSRPHKVESKVPKNAIEQFSQRFRKNFLSISKLNDLKAGGLTSVGDARRMPLADNTVDLVVTSPPYANAIDYMRAHKFSLVWLGDSVQALADLRSRYIGSEKTSNLSHGKTVMPQRCLMIINKLHELDRKKALILGKYFSEMENVIAEIYRVLKPDSTAIIIVGTSTMRGINVQTHFCLADIAADLGFKVIGVVERILDRNKRMMPARFGKNNQTSIEQRMHEEYVIGLYKGE